MRSSAGARVRSAGVLTEETHALPLSLCVSLSPSPCPSPTSTEEGPARTVGGCPLRARKGASLAPEFAGALILDLQPPEQNSERVSELWLFKAVLFCFDSPSRRTHWLP